MVAFDFVTNENFRASLESDYGELQRCKEAKAWKAVHVLAGSIIEAVLVDYLVATSYHESDPLRMDLAHLISVCAAEDILSEKAANLAEAVKSYRNLIHPGRVVRLRETVDENGATIAQALVEIVVDEVSARRRESYGYTAEQVVSKLRRDPSASAILAHLLKEVQPTELKRLLLRVIPQEYFLVAEEGPPFEPPDFGALSSLRQCFRLALELVNDEVKKEATSKYVSVLKEEPGPYVRRYEEAFFRASDLRWVSTDAVALVKQHLLARLKSSASLEFLEVIEGLGEFLDENDASEFANSIPRLLTRSGDTRLGIATRKYVENEYWDMEDGVRNILTSRLEVWIAFLDGKGQHEDAEKVRGLRDGLVSDLPF